MGEVGEVGDGRCGRCGRGGAIVDWGRHGGGEEEGEGEGEERGEKGGNGAVERRETRRAAGQGGLNRSTTPPPQRARFCHIHPLPDLQYPQYPQVERKRGKGHRKGRHGKKGRKGNGIRVEKMRNEGFFSYSLL